MKKSVKGKNYQYTVFFEKNETAGYTITVPALPGLATEGKTLAAAERMAKDAIRCYIEGLKKAREKIPEERESVQVRLQVLV